MEKGELYLARKVESMYGSTFKYLYLEGITIAKFDFIEAEDESWLVDDLRKLEVKDDGYMQLNVDIDTKNIDLEEYVSMQKKSIADMCNVPEEKVIPISRLEYETYTDE